MTAPVVIANPSHRAVVHIVLVVLAVIAFVIVTAIGFGWAKSDDATGWLGLGLALLASAFLI